MIDHASIGDIVLVVAQVFLVIAAWLNRRGIGRVSDKVDDVHRQVNTNGDDTPNGSGPKAYGRRAPDQGESTVAAMLKTMLAEQESTNENVSGLMQALNRHLDAHGNPPHKPIIR